MSNPIDEPKAEIVGYDFGRSVKVTPENERRIYLTEITVRSAFAAVLTVASPKNKIKFSLSMQAQEIVDKNWMRGLPGAQDKPMFIETTQDAEINYCAVEA